jgi:hypothetical protein
MKSSVTSRSSRRSSRQGTLYRQRTTRFSLADMNDLDVMVLSYSCFNEATKPSINVGCYEATWKVQLGQQHVPIVIQLHVDKNNPGTPNVCIKNDGERIFPSDSTCEMAKIKGDFQKKWHFIGTMEGMHKTNNFEIRTDWHTEWLRATMMSETPEGSYEMEAEMPDAEGSFKKVIFPAVPGNDIRYASSHKVASARERFLMLEVPAQDPSHAVLSVDDCELVTHYFARPSPPPGVPPQSLNLQVSRDRSQVFANMGHNAMTQYLKSEVSAVIETPPDEACDVFKRSWVIRVGHFAEHTILIEQSQPEHAHFRLLVDGEPLVEASLDDLDREDDHWECTFHLVGQRSIIFDLHEMDENGSRLESIGRATQMQRTLHECRVIIQYPYEERSAELFIDDTHFDELPLSLTEQDEALVQISLEELKALYGITVPHKLPCRSILDIDEYCVEDEPLAFGSRRNREDLKWFSCCGVGTQSSVNIEVRSLSAK